MKLFNKNKDKQTFYKINYLIYHNHKIQYQNFYKEKKQIQKIFNYKINYLLKLMKNCNKCAKTKT